MWEVEFFMGGNRFLQQTHFYYSTYITLLAEAGGRMSGIVEEVKEPCTGHRQRGLV